MASSGEAWRLRPEYGPSVARNPNGGTPTGGAGVRNSVRVTHIVEACKSFLISRRKARPRRSAGLGAVRDEFPNEGRSIGDGPPGDADEPVAGTFVYLPERLAESHRVLERHDALLVGPVDGAPRFEEEHLGVIPKRFGGGETGGRVCIRSDRVDDAIKDHKIEEDGA